MNTKKLFGTALSMFFAFGLLVGLNSNSSNKANDVARLQTRGVSLRDDSPSAADFHAVDIGRNELTIDVTSLTSTSRSKSATITFKSTRLVGWGPSGQNVYVIIDDPDYSGSTDNPSLSGKEYPTLDGYTVELVNKSTMSYNDKDDQGQKITVKQLIVPEMMDYAGSFKIQNKKIVKDAFIFSKTPAIQYIIIPAGITEIESRAFQNIPADVTIRVEGTQASKTGWAEDWIVNSQCQIEWEYTLSSSEENYRKQGTGIQTKYYGNLVNVANYADEAAYSIVNDVNFTGDFANPYRTTYQTSNELSAYVSDMDLSKVGENFIIPEKVNFTSGLVLKNTMIAKDAFTFSKVDEENPYSLELRNIYIPASIETVESNAFKNVPEQVQIYVEGKDSKPITWADNWTNAKASQIHWNATISGSKESNINNTDTKVRLSNQATGYVIGYKYLEQKDYYYCPYDKLNYTEDQLVDGKANGHEVLKVEDETPVFNKPIYVSYEIKNTKTGETREVWKEMPLLSEEDTSTTTSYFDTVRDSSISRSFDIILEEDEQYVEESVKVYNIFRQKTITKMVDTVVADEEGNARVEKKAKSFIVPDTSVCFVASANKSYKREININEIIDYKFESLTKFGDYSLIKMNVDKVLPSYWLDAIGEDIYATHKDSIDSGRLSIRYCIYGLNNSFYRLTYLSNKTNQIVTKTIPVVTPKSVIEIEKDSGNGISFLIYNKDVADDFALENLKNFEIIGLTLNIHLWDNEKAVKIGLTDINTHFGAIDVLPYSEEKASVYDVILFIILFLLGLTILFVGGAVALFFFLKEKYKNDEFRRMNTKKYVKSCIISYLGTLIIAATVLFIAFRGGRFNNSISVHNPLDVFIVVPAIISIVVIGYFIKFLVTTIKERKKRKKALKLKLDQDVVDDGTK